MPTHPPPIIDMVKQLIATPSVSSVNPSWDMGNRGIIELLESWLSRLGFKTEILPIDNHPNKFNLIATAGTGPEGLVLSGHTDTVPFDEIRWKSDPLRISERDNRLYGMGTSDMKSFFALILEAIRELPLDRLKQPLVILATADEESSMCGAKALTEMQRNLGRHVMIGEPTGLKPIRMHKGIAMESIRLIGQAGHSSNPDLGVSALEGMHLVIADILQWRQSLQQRYRNTAFEVAVPTLNLGHIHGGDNPNRICGACELQFDLRPLPGMYLNELRQELRERLGNLLSTSGLEWELVPLFEGIEAMETAANAPIVQTLEKLTGYPAGAVAFGTEGPYLNDMGMETVICGPGYIDQAHQPDEYLPLEHIQPGVKLIQSLIRKFCLDSND